MADYSNPTTPLTARAYQWSATITCGPVRPGSVPSQDRTGTYTPPSGATVGTLLNAIRDLHARENNIPIQDAVIVRYSLREK